MPARLWHGHLGLGKEMEVVCLQTTHAAEAQGHHQPPPPGLLQQPWQL